MELAMGMCGIACEVCKHFNQGCLGCGEENRIKPRCLIFNCAKKKKIISCIRCPDFSCGLMRGLSKAYCPVFTEIKFE